jgi:prophage regulatory protein
VSKEIEQTGMPMSNSPSPSTERMLTMREVCALTTYSRPSLYRLIGAGLFPSPLKLGHKVAFRQADIIAWIATRPVASIHTIAPMAPASKKAKDLANG